MPCQQAVVKMENLEIIKGGIDLSSYIMKRCLMVIPVILGVILLIFIILQASPGDPARMILGEAASNEQVEALRIELGLNDPIAVQLGRYLLNLVQGDFGTSYVSKTPVLQEVLTRFPTTLLLATLSVVFMVILGIPIGIISAVKQYSWVDNISTTIALIGVSMPTFWTGMLMVMLFSLYLGWLPASGFYGPKYWLMPALSIGIANAATMTRLTRSSMLEVIRQDYIRTARAKGQSERKVILNHAFKNSLLPVITMIGIQLGIALGGAMVTESVFSIPGLGSYMLSAIKTRDYPVIQGGVILIATSFCIVNLIVDILYAFIDPRIKAQYKSKAKNIKKIQIEEDNVA